MFKKKLTAAVALAVGISSQAQAAPVDIAFIIDQSASMGGEFNFIDDAMNQIDASLQTAAGVDSIRYGVVGYMENPKLRDNGTTNLIYQDLTGSIADVTAQVVPRPTLYASRESGYEAAFWSQTGFSWNNDAAKIMILITDETGDQVSDLGPGSPAFGSNNVNNAQRIAREEFLGDTLDGNGFLLNVITKESLFAIWDDAVFDINDPAYSGLFSLDDLRDDAAAFTDAFVAAKVDEILDNLPPDPGPGPGPGPNPVPEPAGLALLGIGLLGLLRRRRVFK